MTDTILILSDRPDRQVKQLRASLRKLGFNVLALPLVDIGFDSRYPSGRCRSWVKVKNPDYQRRAEGVEDSGRRELVEATLAALRRPGALAGLSGE